MFLPRAPPWVTGGVAGQLSDMKGRGISSLPVDTHDQDVQVWNEQVRQEALHNLLF